LPAREDALEPEQGLAPASKDAPNAKSAPDVRTQPALEAFFRHRGTVLALVAAPIAAFALAGLPLEPWEIALGGALLAAGALLRILSVRRIGKRARVRTSGAARLLCEGPFARTRNPLYLANLHIAAGACVLAGLGPWAPLAVLYVFLVYHVVVRAEEVTLRDLFGERYDLYLERVPRWLPRLTSAAPIESSPAPLHSWGDVLGREGPTMLLGVLAAFLGLVYVRWPGPGIDRARSLLASLGSALHVPAWAVVVGIVLAVALVEGIATDMKRRRHERGRALAAETRSPS